MSAVSDAGVTIAEVRLARQVRRSRYATGEGKP